MTPNEITTLIATAKGKELDVPFKKIIYERVKYWRSTLIKQSLDKVRQQARFFRQTIYLPMQLIDRMSIIAPTPMHDFQAVSVYDVPLPLRTSDNGMLNYVGAMGGQSPFGWADSGTLSYLKAGKYSGNQIYYGWWNNKLTTSDLPNLSMAMIEGVFNEPEEAMKLYTGEYVYDLDWWDMNIPMSGDIEQRVVQCILSVDFADKQQPKSEDYQVQTNGENQ